jgi:DNA replication protein DnaC
MEVTAMLNENTVMKLHEMKLSGMAEALDIQMRDKDFEQLSFEERFGLIVDAEHSKRQNNRITRLIKDAGYVINACIEDIEYHEDRKIDRNLIKRLSTCNYIHSRQNVIILGPTGSGKSFLANALGMAASRMRISVRYAKLPDLLSELAVARGEGRYRKCLKHYLNAKLLILDEWLLFPLSMEESRDLFDLIDVRHSEGSTILCSQFDVSGWHAKIGEPTLADALCDRIVHNAHKIIIGGKDSMRCRKSSLALETDITVNGATPR